ncbi:MAG TPA: AraC family transcriptional regulator [Cytophagales bacterium]|nr:AraC family transcriptional regulator [Cytophagales bacterium]
MEGHIRRFKTVSELHQQLQLPKPKHPLISIMDASDIFIDQEQVGKRYLYEFYMITLKDGSCGVEYGRNSLDFEEGVMAFSSPRQVFTNTAALSKGDLKGDILFFHPDLIRNTHLTEMMDTYSFFNYEVFEALHLSEEEEQRIRECLQNIKGEYEQRIDNHSHRVMVSNLELLLNYGLRFYERQFNPRPSHSKDVVTVFTKQLKAYFLQGQLADHGLPSVQYFSDHANLSQHYFSDLIKKETGRTPKDHINDYVVERAKDLLLGSEQSVSAIAYDLGFNYPHYFTRLFKSRTGKTPAEYRSLQ